MKQFFCVLVTVLASAALLFLVSAPVNSIHEAEGSETTSAHETHAETDAGNHVEE